MGICVSVAMCKLLTAEEAGVDGVLKELEVEESSSDAETALRGFGARTEGVLALSRRIERAFVRVEKLDKSLSELGFSIWFGLAFRADMVKP